MSLRSDWVMLSQSSSLLWTSPTAFKAEFHFELTYRNSFRVTNSCKKGSLTFILYPFVNTPSVTTPTVSDSALFCFFLPDCRFHPIRKIDRLWGLNEAKPVRLRYGLFTDSKSFNYSITGDSCLFHFQLNRKLTGLDFHQLDIIRLVTHLITLINTDKIN